MRILLTNDDGIYAEGIYALYLELKKLGKVSVVAPDSERSSVGHGITLASPLWHKRVSWKGKFFGYGISGTPADCVKMAVGVLFKKPPDLVVSGINLGPNDGCSVYYSGTVAGAREGCLCGIPSISVSLDTFKNPKFSYAAQYTRQLAKKIMKTGLPKGTFLNVNVPNLSSRNIKGVRFTKQCLVPIHGDFREKKDPDKRVYHWMSGKTPMRRKSESIDTYALSGNYVTVTPILNDSTDHVYLKKILNGKLK